MLNVLIFIAFILVGGVTFLVSNEWKIALTIALIYYLATSLILLKVRQMIHAENTKRAHKATVLYQDLITLQENWAQLRRNIPISIGLMPSIHEQIEQMDNDIFSAAEHLLSMKPEQVAEYKITALQNLQLQINALSVQIEEERTRNL